MDFQNFQSTADVLSNSGSLFVQKIATRWESIHSAALRPVGFIAIDGVRMNNLIFRAGHLKMLQLMRMLDNVGVFWSCFYIIW
jgi:hemoglobin/transferrin/lactoferrin receptor protein